MSSFKGGHMGATLKRNAMYDLKACLEVWVGWQPYNGKVSKGKATDYQQ